MNITAAQRRVLRQFHCLSARNRLWPGQWFRHDFEIAAKLQRRGLLCRLSVNWNEHSFSHVTGLSPKGYAVLGIPDPWQRGELLRYPTHIIQMVTPRTALEDA